MVGGSGVGDVVSCLCLFVLIKLNVVLFGDDDYFVFWVVVDF